VIPYPRGVPAVVGSGRVRLVRRYHRPHRLLHPAEPVLDARRYGLPRDQLYLATTSRRWITAPWQQSAIVIGPPGSGKSRSVIAPNMLLLGGAAGRGDRDPGAEGRTMGAMATEPQRDPIEDEAARVLAENPGLREELEEFGRAYDAGEIPVADLIPHEEVRRRLARLGVPLPPPEP